MSNPVDFVRVRGWPGAVGQLSRARGRAPGGLGSPESFQMSFSLGAIELPQRLPDAQNFEIGAASRWVGMGREARTVPYSVR